MLNEMSPYLRTEVDEIVHSNRTRAFDKLWGKMRALPPDDALAWLDASLKIKKGRKTSEVNAMKQIRIAIATFW